MEYVSPRGKDSARKAESFALYAKQFGWSGKWREEDGGITHLFARRGELETMDVRWCGGSILPGQEPIYTLAGERIKMRNLSAAAKIVAGRVDPDRLKKAARKRKVGNGFAETNSVEDIEALRGSLPFDSESADDEIEAVLHRRSITWINRFDGSTDTAFINADKQFKVHRLSEGRDQIHFCDTAHGGFRAVYLNSIVAVG